MNGKVGLLTLKVEGQKSREIGKVLYRLYGGNWEALGGGGDIIE